MAQTGQIGGARDINAQRSACSNASQSFDQADARFLSLVSTFDGYTQEDFIRMGNSDDDAYYLADQLPKIRAILESSADWQALRDFAAKTRDVGRFM